MIISDRRKTIPRLKKRPSFEPFLPSPDHTLTEITENPFIERTKVKFDGCMVWKRGKGSAAQGVCRCIKVINECKKYEFAS